MATFSTPEELAKQQANQAVLKAKIEKSQGPNSNVGTSATSQGRIFMNAPVPTTKIVSDPNSVTGKLQTGIKPYATVNPPPILQSNPAIPNPPPTISPAPNASGTSSSLQTTPPDTISGAVGAQKNDAYLGSVAKWEETSKIVGVENMPFTREELRAAGSWAL
jgi:hypothetical protein